MATGTTLAEQYNKTLQSTIGQSQQERQRAMRSAPSQVASTDPSMDWASRQASGFRGAGFQPVSLSNVPQQQIQGTKDILVLVWLVVMLRVVRIKKASMVKLIHTLLKVLTNSLSLLVLRI